MSTGKKYFDLEKVQDAHARSRCRDLNGTEAWSCGDCDCSARLEAASPRRAVRSSTRSAPRRNALVFSAGAAGTSECGARTRPRRRSRRDPRRPRSARPRCRARTSSPSARCSRKRGCCRTISISAATALGRPPDTFRDTVSSGRLATLWRLHGRLASARGDQSRAIALHERALKQAETAHDSRAIGLAHYELGAVLPPGRRHRDRARAHHQGRVRAARRRRPAAPRARPLAVGHPARPGRPLRRSDGRAAPRRAARLDGAGRRRPGDRVRQPGRA